MLALYIILGIIALITALLFIEIKISICYKELFFIKIKYIFTVYNSDKQKVSKSKKADSKQKRAEPFSKIKSMLSSFDSLLELFKLIKNLLAALGKYLKRVKVYNTEFLLSVAGEDAASTAIKYGLACSVIYPTLTLISKTVNFAPKQIDINTDFTSEKFSVGIYSDISVKPIYVIRFIFSFAWIYIKSKIERNKK